MARSERRGERRGGPTRARIDTYREPRVASASGRSVSASTRNNASGRGAATNHRPELEPVNHLRRLTIIAQDPSVPGDGQILTAEASIPVERLEEGPRGHRFHVVDVNPSTGQLVQPVPDFRDPDVPEPERDWSCKDRFRRAKTGQGAKRQSKAYLAALQSDPAFRAQNVYAIAARTLAAFEFALGRRIEWAFGSHQLYIVPRAFAEANAHYSRDDRGLFFGFLPRSGKADFHTCLSHDIVCHETTHAILDGLRRRFLEPTLPDQPAFHEAVADIVAILSVFSLPEVVGHALGKADVKGRVATPEFSASDADRDILFDIGEEFGEVTGGVRGSALRRSRELAPGDGWRDDPAFDEPHRRGEVLVAAVIDGLVGMWARRLETVEHEGTVNRERAAEEGAKAASHLLTMIIRSLDYSPTVEIEFEDVIDAIIVADEIVAPDDRHDYRKALLDSFGRFGIHRPHGRIIDLTKMPVPFRYDGINAAALRSSKDEAFRFLWQNLEALELSSEWHIQIESLRPADRIGPDGLVVHEVVCDYIQMVEMTAEQARGRAKRQARRKPGKVERPDGDKDNVLVVPDPADVPDETPLQFLGGGTLIFDQFGRIKLHQRKDLADWARQSERLAYLARKRLFDRDQRLGFSTGAATGMAFADLHAPDAVAGEAW